MEKFLTIEESTNAEQGIFSIRGDLDGTKEAADFSEVKQFIGLMIGGEEFLLPIEVMNEIIMLHQLTYVPGSHTFIEGVINLRGKIIATINLRKMMGLPAEPPTSSTRVIISQYEDHTAGLIVDGITYVVSLNPEQLESQNLANGGNGANIISGISKRGDQVNGIIDIIKVLNEAGGRVGIAAEE